VTGATAAIATSDPRATEIGADVLRSGGTCVDAAVAAALALFVVEPHHCGPGGDAFLLVQRPDMDAPVALDGAGRVPAGLVAAGGPVVPFGPTSVTVPGATSLLAEATARWGSRRLATLAEPAQRLAADGYEVRPTLADASAGAQRRLAADPVLGPLHLVDGAPPAVGTTLRNPALAALLGAIGERGAAAVHDGAVAEDIAATVRAQGGYLALAEVHDHRTVETPPVATHFAGCRVWQLREPTQGPAVLAALDLLAGTDLEAWDGVPGAIIDGLRTVGVDLVAAPWLHRQGGTSHIAVVDGQGGVASLITSVFAPFGSGVGVASLGGALQNRAAGFLLVGTPPTAGKPPHTIIPGLVTRDGTPEMAIGVAGGLMQVQGQVQLLVRTLHRGEPAQAAIDAPRLRVVEGGELALEPGHPLAAADPAALERAPGDGGFGAAQIARTVDGGAEAAADHRRDGAAAHVRVEGGVAP
jgi:gamma-glutamyltranspeptidase/glutathione hydrolase